ncbi:adhesion G protein-coupled receptor B2 [Trichonephila clavipes]|nr:adhesion G protein-coupled receptor B2 [Trichonephila clavipes]
METKSQEDFKIVRKLSPNSICCYPIAAYNDTAPEELQLKLAIRSQSERNVFNAMYDMDFLTNHCWLKCSIGGPLWIWRFLSKCHDNLVELHFKYDFWHMTTTAASEVVKSGRPILDDFFQHLWPYIGNNTANVVFQMVKRLWLIRIDQ